MEKIKGLEEQEFQDVIDVLGQVSTRFDPAFVAVYSLTPRPSVRGHWGRDERAPEAMPQVPVQDMRDPWSLTDTVRTETQRFTAIRSSGLQRRVRRSVEGEVQ